MIEIVVEDVIEAQLEDILQLMGNITSYSQWWPVPTQAIDQQSIQFRPVVFVTIRLFRHRERDPNRLRFTYLKGPFRGLGEWQFIQVNEQQVKVSYKVKLKAVNSLVKLVAKSSLFRQKHIRDIKQIIAAMEKQLKR